MELAKWPGWYEESALPGADPDHLPPGGERCPAPGFPGSAGASFI
ncbi:MAG: hypothetical protein AB1815_06600 [Bacillota bacterium]